jgi:glycine/D-amino acid oxidase-like deaminating enzyme
VDPHRLAHGLLAKASHQGLKVFDRTRILRFIPHRRGIEMIAENGARIRARRAIIAAGFEAKQYLHAEAGTLKSTYALISEPISDLHAWHRRSLIWESGSPYLYLRTTAENRVIVGGEDETFTSSVRRDHLISQKTRILAAKFSSLFPGMKLEVAYSWAGTFGTTKDGLAYIGSPSGLPHTYFALGYGGNGITYSVLAAELIRDDFLGRTNPDRGIFTFGR